MKIIIILGIFCLIELLRAVPLTEDDDDEKIVIPRSLFEKSLVKYTAEHDVVEILVPLNALNFEESKSKNDYMGEITIFFVEADIQNGKRVDRGLYVMKNGKAKNILPTGRTAATTSDDEKTAFFGASDGLYSYNADSNSAAKYGPITDGIISIAVDEAQNTVYIVTDDHKLYKVSNNGETKDLVSDVVDVQEIVLDDYHNIYYYNSNKEVFIRTSDRIIQIRDLPPNPNSVKLIRPPFIMEDSVPLMIDDALYIVYANGTSEAINLEFNPDARPTAYGPEAILVQFYAFNKKIYQYNFIQLIEEPLFEDVKDKTESIHTIASKNKNTLGSKLA